MANDADARDRILDAAEALFAAQGFAATTIKQIGAQAGVNPALLYYYYDSKETLYREMLRRVLATFAGGIAKQLDGVRDPDEAIRRFTTLQAELVLAQPRFVTLLVREMLDHQAAHAEAGIAVAISALFERLCDLVEAGQRSGHFRDDVDPRFAAISTVAQVAYFAIARPAIGMMLGHGANRLPDDVLREFGAHAGRFTVSALAAERERTP